MVNRVSVLSELSFRVSSLLSSFETARYLPEPICLSLHTSFIRIGPPLKVWTFCISQHELVYCSLCKSRSMKTLFWFLFLFSNLCAAIILCYSSLSKSTTFPAAVPLSGLLELGYFATCLAKKSGRGGRPSSTSFSKVVRYPFASLC